MPVASGIGHSVDLATWLHQEVCFSSRRRDPQALCRAMLPTVYRQEHPHFMLYSCMPSSSYTSPAPAGSGVLFLFIYRLIGLLSVSCIQTLDCWFRIVISLLWYSTTTYYTLKCGLVRDWAWKFFSKHGFLSDSGFELPPSRIKGTQVRCSTARLRYAASLIPLS